jgi:hypothetical protein
MRGGRAPILPAAAAARAPLVALGGGNGHAGPLPSGNGLAAAPQPQPYAAPTMVTAVAPPAGTAEAAAGRRAGR